MCTRSHRSQVEPELLVRLTLALSPMVLAPFELAPAGFLYVLHRGLVIVAGELLLKGSTWGEDIILNDVAPSLCRPTHARGIVYAEVFLMTWEELDDALAAFPRAVAHVRKCAIRLAFRRQILRVAAIARRVNATKITELTAEQMALDEPSSVANARQVTLTRGREGTRPPPRGKRGKTFKHMLKRTLDASEAEVSLQMHLINMRRGGSTGAIAGGAEVALGEVAADKPDAMEATYNNLAGDVGASSSEDGRGWWSATGKEISEVAQLRKEMKTEMAHQSRRIDELSVHVSTSIKQVLSVVNDLRRDLKLGA
jgi:hypothetical protein